MQLSAEALGSGSPALTTVGNLWVPPPTDGSLCPPREQKEREREEEPHARCLPRAVSHRLGSSSGLRWELIADIKCFCALRKLCCLEPSKGAPHSPSLPSLPTSEISNHPAPCPGVCPQPTTRESLRCGICTRPSRTLNPSGRKHSSEFAQRGSALVLKLNSWENLTSLCLHSLVGERKIPLSPLWWGQ